MWGCDEVGARAQLLPAQGPQSASGWRPRVLSLALPDRKAPLIVDSVCSILWCSLTAIWVLVISFLERRKIEEALREAHDELEVCVEERIRDLALVNEALVEAIGEGRETERSLGFRSVVTITR